MEEMFIDVTSTQKKPPPFFSKWFRLFTRESSFAIGSLPFVWQVLFFFLPLCSILIVGFSVVDQTGQIVRISFSSFARVLNLSYLSITMNSLLLAISTTFLCLILGFPLAYFMAFQSGKLRKLLLFLLIIPFWTNFILHIYAWFFVLEKNGFLNNLLLHIGLLSDPLHLLNSYFAVLLMMVYFYLPFMVLPILSSLERFDPCLLEASMDLGANRFQTICRILLPITSSAIKSGLFLVFIPAFGEFVIPELMGGDKIVYVGNVISLYMMGDTSVPYGVAFTLICTLVLFGALFLLNGSVNRLSRILSRGRL